METDRVRCSTADHINERIDLETKERLEFYATQSPESIGQRLEELDQEWSVERWIETLAPSLALTGIGLGATVNKKWLWFSGGVLGFLLLHGLQGWCPPVPVLRRMGVRTRGEIDREKFGLKILRGDFDNIQGPGEVTRSAQRLFEALEV
jgi:hypothetical protein